MISLARRPALLTGGGSSNHANHHPGEHFCRRVPGDLATSLRLHQTLVDKRHRALDQQADALGALFARGLRQPVVECEPQNFRILANKCQAVHEEQPQAAKRIATFRRKSAFHRLLEQVDRCVHDLFLIAEMTKDRPVRDTHLPGQGCRRQAMNPLLGEDPEGRLGDLPPSLGSGEPLRSRQSRILASKHLLVNFQGISPENWRPQDFQHRWRPQA